MEKWKKLLRDDETNRRNSGLLFFAESGRHSLILFCTGYKKRDRVTSLRRQIELELSVYKKFWHTYY